MNGDFDTDCRAAGIRIDEQDREVVFALWQENRQRRLALRDAQFAPEEPVFSLAFQPVQSNADRFAPPAETQEVLHYKPAAELAGMLRRREISAREIAEAILQRIETHDPILKAFERIDGQRALQAADAADVAFSRGDDLGPLQGIPVACKAFVAAQGLPHTAGSLSRSDILAADDAELLANLRDAGAVYFGQLNTHEFGAGAATKDGPRATGRNPWNIDRIPGGSSSGSAVAVASGMLPGAVGTDSAGSIRMPAGNCNIVGLKPTFSLVSSDGVFPYSWSLDTAGILSRTVVDAGLYLEGMIGKEAQGRYSSTLDKGLCGRVLGVPRSYFWDRADIRDDVRVACEKVLEVLQRAGAILREIEIEGVEWNDAIYTTLLAEVWSVHRDAINSRPELYNDWFRQNTIAGGIATAHDVVAAHRMRGRLAKEFARVFREVEALVLPGQAVPATPFAKSFTTALTQPRSQFMRPFNVTGLPAIAVPCGFSEDGLPVAINFAGPVYGDSDLLSIARGYERETEYWRQHPDESKWIA